jgi:hypothetical protein
MSIILDLIDLANVGPVVPYFLISAYFLSVTVLKTQFSSSAVLCAKIRLAAALLGENSYDRHRGSV